MEFGIGASALQPPWRLNDHGTNGTNGIDFYHRPIEESLIKNDPLFFGSVRSVHPVRHVCVIYVFMSWFLVPFVPFNSNPMQSKDL